MHFRTVIWFYLLSLGFATATEKSDISDIYRQGQDLNDTKRDELIKLTEDILKTKENRESPDLWLRLAEYYWEKGLSEFIKGGDAMDKGDDPKSNRHFAESEKFKAKAIKIYTHILNNFKDYRDIDKVLLLLGLALYETGDKKQAVELLERVAKESKNTTYRINAYLSLGEHYFNDQKPDLAVQYFGFLLRYKDSKFYKYAMYKLAWCYINMKKHREAFGLFKTIITLESNDTFNNKADGIVIGPDAANGIVLAFSEMVEGSEAKTAKSLFFSISPQNYLELLYKLINLFFDQGKNAETIIVALDFLVLDPFSKYNPPVARILFDAYFKIDRFPESILSKKDYLNNYNPKSPWFNHPSRTKEEQEKVLAHLDTVLTSLIDHYMTISTKLKKKDLIDEAKSLYQRYFEYFPTSKKRFFLHLNYAEFLFKLGEYMSAYDHYVELMKSDMQRDLKLKSANAAIVSLESLKSESKEKKSLPADLNNKLLVGYELFIKLSPGKREVISTTYAMGKLYQEMKDIRKAEQTFLSIIEKDDTTEEATLSAMNILQMYNELKDYRNLNRYAKQFLANKDLHKGTFKDDLLKIVETSSFQLIGEIEQAGEHEKAAQAYLDFIKEFPQSAFSDKAYNNAGINFEKSGFPPKAIDCYERIVMKYPKSQLFGGSVKNIVRIHTLSGEFKMLAEFMERYATSYPKDEISAKYLYQAAVFQEYLANIGKAVALYLHFNKVYPNDPKNFNLAYKIANIYLKANDRKNALLYFKRYLDEPKINDDYALNSYYELGKLSGSKEKKNYYESGIGYFDRQVKKKTGLKEGLEAVAKMRLYLVEELYQKYMATNLGNPKTKNLESVQKQYLKEIGAKNELKDRLDKEFLGIIELGIKDVAIEILVKIAELRVEFQRMLLEYPAVKTYKPEEQEMYRNQILSDTQNQIDEAVGYLRKAVETAFKFNIYNNWTNVAQDKLAKLSGEIRFKQVIPLQGDNLDYIFNIN